MNFKGQGALEYLLMIGAGVAIAAIVMVFVFTSGSSSQCENFKTQVRSMCAAKPSQDLCEGTGYETVLPGQLGTDTQCVWDTGKNQCVTNESAIDWTDSEYCK